MLIESALCIIVFDLTSWTLKFPYSLEIYEINDLVIIITL